MPLQLSLIIPCYNEGENIGALIQRCEEVQDNRLTFILVDNGSSDSSVAVLANLRGKVSTVRSLRLEENQGYGGGILAGLQAATTSLVGWTHADLQCDPLDAVRALDVLESVGAPDHTLVKGQRTSRRLADRFFTIGMAVVASLALRQSMWDINGQPTVFHASLLDLWATPPRDFQLDLFAYYMATRHGFSVERIPVAFRPRRHGASSWNRGFRSTVRYSFETMEYAMRLGASAWRESTHNHQSNPPSKV